MKIERYKIKGYRSIAQKAEIQLGDLTVLIGKNNSGKSAVIDSIRDYCEYRVGRSNPTWSSRYTDKNPEAKLVYDLTFKLSEEERSDLLDEWRWKSDRIGKSVIESWMPAERLRHIRIIFPVGAHSLDPILMIDFDGSWIPIRSKNHENNIVGYIYDPDEGWTNGRSPDFENLCNRLINEFLKKSRYVESFRRPSDVLSVSETTDLEPDGENLVRVLHTLNNNAGDEFDEIIEAYKTVMSGVTDIDTPLSANNTTTAISETGLETAFRFEDVSAGSKEILTLITQIVLSKRDTELLLIEEPELHLHPNAERKVYRLIEELVENESGPQVIITTHSDVFVNETDAKNVVRVDRDEETGNSTLQKAAEGGTEEILLDLGYDNSALFRASKVVFVEGPSDQAIFAEFAKTLANDESRNIEPLSDAGITVHSVGGGQMEKYGPQLANIVGRLGIPYLFVIDSDDKPSDEKEEEMKSTIRSQNIYALQRYSIESYLIESPRAIGRVFGFDEEEVSDFLEDNENRPNPKSVLKDLLREFEDEPLSYDETEHGRLIARHMGIDEIANEIAQLLIRIQSQS